MRATGGRWRRTLLLGLGPLLMLMRVATGNSGASLRHHGLGSLSLVSHDFSASGSYEYDGSTTYCWQVASSVYTNSVDSSAVTASASGSDCLLQLAISLDSTDVYTADSVAVTWTASVQTDSNGTFADNTFDISELYLALDRLSQTEVEIIHSRLHSCASGMDCDPVLHGSLSTDNSTNVVGNFTDSEANFSNTELSFSEAGNYTILAHIILPGKEPEQLRYDFAVFTTVEVQSKTSTTTTTAPYATTTTSASDDGMSTQTLCGIIIGGVVCVSLVVIGFTTMRTKGAHAPLQKSSATLNGRSQALNRRNNTTLFAIAGDSNDNDFAMLSVCEFTMSTAAQPSRDNTFLSAIARGKPGTLVEGSKPTVNFVGPMAPQHLHQGEGSEGSASISSDGSQRTITLETPTSTRNNDGTYSNMLTTPSFSDTNSSFQSAGTHKRLPMSHAFFNDIQEDEVLEEPGLGDLDHLGISRQLPPAANLDDVSQRIRDHANAMRFEQEKKETSKLTFDDLRRSLTLSDLGSVKGGPNWRRHQGSDASDIL